MKIKVIEENRDKIAAALQKINGAACQHTASVGDILAQPTIAEKRQGHLGGHTGTGREDDRSVPGELSGGRMSQAQIAIRAAKHWRIWGPRAALQYTIKRGCPVRLVALARALELQCMP